MCKIISQDNNNELVYYLMRFAVFVNKRNIIINIKILMVSCEIIQTLTRLNNVLYWHILWITKLIYAFPNKQKRYYCFPKVTLWKNIWKNIYIRFKYFEIIIFLNTMSIYGLPYAFAL